MAPFVGDDDRPRHVLDAHLRRRLRHVPPPGRRARSCRSATDEWLLELFHGPTLAFKDVALQLVGRLFDHVLGQRGERVTIVGATRATPARRPSTRVPGCAQRRHRDPLPGGPGERGAAPADDHGRRAERPHRRRRGHVRRLPGPREGDVRRRSRSATGIRLSAVNSINWARVMAQIVYYVTAAGGARRPAGVASPCPPATSATCSPAGSPARMGAPIDRFVDRLEPQRHPHPLPRRPAIMATSEVVPTLSPSMDIQVSSNFERLLFEMNGRDGGMTAEQLHRFRATGSLAVEADQCDAVAGAGRSGPPASTTPRRWPMIARTSTPRPGMLVDPHTAVGIGAGRGAARDAGRRRWSRWPPPTRPSSPTRSSGRPASGPPLPAHLADLFERPERTAVAAERPGRGRGRSSHGRGAASLDALHGRVGRSGAGDACDRARHGSSSHEPAVGSAVALRRRSRCRSPLAGRGKAGVGSTPPDRRPAGGRPPSGPDQSESRCA